MTVLAPPDLQIGDLVIQRMYSPTEPRWSSPIGERVAHGRPYGAPRLMRVAGIDTEAWRAMYGHLSGLLGPWPYTVRWWLVDPQRPRDESRMSWVESDWCVLERAVEEGALF